MKMDRIKLVLDWDDPAPGALKGYFAEIFASLDAQPRPLLVTVKAHNDRGARVSVAFKDGNPVFRIEGRKDVPADFRGRWLPEHPVPFYFPEYGTCTLALIPTTGNRVKVRPATLWERLFK